MPANSSSILFYLAGVSLLSDFELYFPIYKVYDGGVPMWDFVKTLQGNELKCYSFSDWKFSITFTIISIGEQLICRLGN